MNSLRPSEIPAAAATSESSEPGRSLPRQLWVAIRKNWMLAVGMALTIVIATAFYTLSQTKIYQATATVMFDPTPPKPLGKNVEAATDLGSGLFWYSKEYYRTQFWIIKSPAITGAVVRELALQKDPAFIANAPSGARLPPRQISVEAAADILASRLVIEMLRDSRLAEVHYRDADPARAQRILSRVVDIYVEHNLDTVLELVNTSADWLRGQLGGLKKDLESSENALHAYKKHKNVLSVSIDDQANMLRSEMSRLHDALTDRRTTREHVAARRTELQKVKPEDPAELPAMELINSPVLQGLRSIYVETCRELESLLASGKGPNHTAVLAVTARKEESRAALLREVRNIQQAVEGEWTSLNAEIAGLGKLYEDAKQRALNLNLLEIEYNRLVREKSTNERLFSIVTERAKESDLARMLRVNNIRVAQRPRLPGGPISPVVPLNLGVGAAVGLLLGLVLAIGREQLDRSVKTPDDFESLGVAFLGLVPAAAGAGRAKRRFWHRKQREEPQPAGPAELVVHNDPTSGAAEAARAIRTNILFMSPDHPYGTLLVTSAGPSEGKTTVACCIATAMATAGQRVVLLDCDMRRPRAHRVFGFSNHQGVTTALLDPDTLDEIIHPTQVPNMSVVCTGPIPPNPSELLHSDAFARVLSELKRRFDLVVIDSPPIVPVTDAAVLATKVDGVVLVVRAFETSRELARRAVRSLNDVGGHIVGAVLNAVSPEGGGYGYGYYQYHYYRRDGYRADPDTDATSEQARPN